MHDLIVEHLHRSCIRVVVHVLRAIRCHHAAIPTTTDPVRTQTVAVCYAVRMCAQCDCRVVVNYSRSSDAADAVCEEIQGAGGDAVAVQGDVFSADGVKATFAGAMDAYGGLDTRCELLPFLCADGDTTIDIEDVTSGVCGSGI